MDEQRQTKTAATPTDGQPASIPAGPAATPATDDTPAQHG
jgi:hypothetical protein